MILIWSIEWMEGERPVELIGLGKAAYDCLGWGVEWDERGGVPPWTQKIWTLMTTLSVKKSNISVK